MTTDWNPIIRVDRSVCPEYPDFVKKAKHPEFELTGPTEFNVAELELWLHPKQKKGAISGNEIYEYLKTNKMLESCCNLADLRAIQARGIDFFRKHFAGKIIFGWGSVILNRDDDLHVPYLCGFDDEVRLGWIWLVDGWLSDRPALRHAN